MIHVTHVINPSNYQGSCTLAYCPINTIYNKNLGSIPLSLLLPKKKKKRKKEEIITRNMIILIGKLNMSFDAMIY